MGVGVDTGVAVVTSLDGLTDTVGVDPVGVDPVGVDPVGVDPVGVDPVGVESVGVDAVKKPMYELLALFSECIC